MFQIGFVGSLPRTYTATAGLDGNATGTVPPKSISCSLSTSKLGQSASCMVVVWFAQVLKG